MRCTVVWCCLVHKGTVRCYKMHVLQTENFDYNPHYVFLIWLLLHVRQQTEGTTAFRQTPFYFSLHNSYKSPNTSFLILILRCQVTPKYKEFMKFQVTLLRTFSIPLYYLFFFLFFCTRIFSIFFRRSFLLVSMYSPVHCPS